MTGPGGGDSDGGSTGPGRYTFLTDPTGEPQPFPPPPRKCALCDKPWFARGLCANHYQQERWRGRIQLYPRTRRVGPAPARARAKPGHCRECGQDSTTCIDAPQCPACVVALRLTVTSAMRGETVTRHCPHVASSSLRDRAEEWAQGLLNAVAGTSPRPVTAHLPVGGNAAALLGSECAAARAEELSAPPGSSAR